MATAYICLSCGDAKIGTPKGAVVTVEGEKDICSVRCMEIAKARSDLCSIEELAQIERARAQSPRN